MLTLEPIGTIATPYTDRYRAPRQPGAALDGAEGTITLLAGRNFEQALEDLAGFDRIWVIYWFHRNAGWKPKVLPPRGSPVKRGVFATRSPHRPNPLGLSLLRLLEVRGRTLRVADVDILDTTPILDIKPYLPYAEAFPNARAGWLEESATAAPGTVAWSELAARQAAWLAAQGVDAARTAEELLAYNSGPHPYRRIRLLSDGRGEIAVTSWRFVFAHVDGGVCIERITSGYTRQQALAPEAATTLHQGAAHAAFHTVWEQ